MINIELKVVDNPLHQKIEKIKMYRLCSIIKFDVEEYLNGYFKYNDSGFRFQTFKNGLCEILNKYSIEYKIDYIYDKDFDNVKVYMGKNFVLVLNIIRDNEFHI